GGRRAAGGGSAGLIDVAGHGVGVGCWGWTSRHWRGGVFYPDRLATRNWLAFYAQHFDTVELNATFYRLPRASAAERWAAGTPDDFTFAVKVSRYVTHVQRLRDAGTHLSLLLDRLEALTGSRKLGPLLWQLPPTVRRHDAR